MDLKKQKTAAYISTFFSGLRFTDAIWVALLAARGFSLWEIGIAESVYHIVSLIFEIPSGMAADILGRRRTVICGGVMMTVYNLLMAFAQSLPGVCLAMGLSALSNSMFSGTYSALYYDSFKQAQKETEYLPFCAVNSQISGLAGAVGSLASPLEKYFSFTGFYLAGAAAESISTLAELALAEPIVTEAQACRRRNGFVSVFHLSFFVFETFLPITVL